jgi:hypothetical protein
LLNFLITEPGQTWNMTGSASYSFFTLSVDIVLTTEVGETLHGAETTLINLEANGSSFGQTARVIEQIQVSLTGENLLLHSRVGKVFFNGELDDEDIDSYSSSGNDSAATDHGWAAVPVPFGSERRGL